MTGESARPWKAVDISLIGVGMQVEDGGDVQGIRDRVSFGFVEDAVIGGAG
ncbi:hypothetical protein ABZ471_44570 [Streptomyces sp. NPDC005728]|uniref:hypothetical protein n=1 Tax=Streptomyces sp. NPDC005728 TaxID=3157054 RepID=UPI0033F44F23